MDLEPSRGTVLRKVNERGHGATLRREIIDAAGALLAETSMASGVTLRGIARRAGIAAPSVYLHFDDRDAVLEAVVSESFGALETCLRSASEAASSGAERVRALCRAYLDFAHRSPGRYRVLFERTGANLSSDSRTYPQGLSAFALLTSALTAAVTEGTSSSSDPIGDSATLWTALHGLATLPPSTPGFPWPPSTQMVDDLATGLAHLLPSRPAA